MPQRTLSEAVIRNLATRESFARGEAYRDAVSGLVRRGEVFSAEVAGSESEPYRVTIRIADGQVADRQVAESRCTCPYEWGGACKHVVATLLTIAENPGAVAVRPTLADMLASLDRDALTNLLLRRSARDPDLAGWIEAEIATTIRPGSAGPIDKDPVAAQARAVLAGRERRRGYWDDVRPRGNADELHALVERAVPFLEAGDGRNALRILEAVAEPLVENWLDGGGYDSDEEGYLLFGDLGRMMAEAALMSDFTLTEREALGATVEDWADSLAEYGVEESFDVAIRALETGWDDLALAAILDGGPGPWPPAGDDDLDDIELVDVQLRVLDATGRHDAYLHLARAAGAETRIATMLIRLGRTGEAVAHADRTFTRADQSLELAEALARAGQPDEGLGVAEAGLRRAQDEKARSTASGLGEERADGSIGTLARWLRDAAGAQGRPDLALTAAGIAFAHGHTIEDFRAVRSAAGDAWARLRRGLLAGLIAADYAFDRTEILLDENMIDEAVTCVSDERGFEAGDAVLLRLMEAAQASHPDWVIRQGESRAEVIMEAGSSGQYARAADWLARAAAAYDADGRIDDWSVRIEGLIERHRRKHKLRPMLEALRYGG